MIPQLVISADVDRRKTAIREILTKFNLSHPHPDVLLFEEEAKFGIAQAKEVIQFLTIKPYRGKYKAVVSICAENMTTEAQNALLKSLEEPPPSCLIVLGAISEDQLLPTVLSRCRVNPVLHPHPNLRGRVRATYEVEEQLLRSNTEERFKIIEGVEDKKALLSALTVYFREKLKQDPQFLPFLKELLLAQRWAKQNVNLRAILEYLMLKMPTLERHNNPKSQNKLA